MKHYLAMKVATLRIVKPAIAVCCVFTYYQKKSDFAVSEASQNLPKSKWDHNWDLRHDSQHEKEKHRIIHQIVLVRHGQYVSNELDEDRKLTEIGKLQAVSTGKRLRDLIDSKHISPPNNVYYSTMTRATETFALIHPFLPSMKSSSIQPCSMIREGAVCKPEPPSASWLPSEENFSKDGSRVRIIMALD